MLYDVPKARAIIIVNFFDMALEIFFYCPAATLLT
jgi:hypothetical protein